MPGYTTRLLTIRLGGHDFRIRALSDLQQFADPTGSAHRAGISSSLWSLFGQLWPSGRVLAEAMSRFDIAGKRILEIGAGLALASLVIHRRGGDITVSDWHPLTADFLQQNLQANGLSPLPVHAGNWSVDDADGASGLGRFDLIIGSDVLYERQQPAQLARFIDQHAALGAEVLIVDPDRGNRSAFGREMALLGFGLTMASAERLLENGDAFKGRFLHLRRH